MSRILVFTGEGKGKTTAAFGMVLRAVGHGKSVAICPFIKSRKDVGEIRSLVHLPGVRLGMYGLGFVPCASSPSYGKHCRAALRSWRWAKVALRSPQVTLVVLDEICGALHKGLLPFAPVREELLRILPGKIVVCTGRHASQELCDLADTVTVMTKVKHGLDHGLQALEGVEK